MRRCHHVDRGVRATGTLPGGLNVRRRAGALRKTLEATDDSNDPLRAMEWVTLYALAVNEENAAGGRVVTAPTNLTIACLAGPSFHDASGSSAACACQDAMLKARMAA